MLIDVLRNINKLTNQIKIIYDKYLFNYIVFLNIIMLFQIYFICIITLNMSLEIKYSLYILYIYICVFSKYI